MKKFLCCMILSFLLFAPDVVCSEPVINYSDPVERTAQLNHIEETLSGHSQYSEYRKTVDSQIFHDYIDELPSSQFKEAKQIMEIGSQEDILGLINNYEGQKNYQKSKRSMILKMINIHNDPYDTPHRISYQKGLLHNWLRKMDVNSALTHFRLKKTDHFSYFFHYATVKNKIRHEYLYEIDTLTNTFRTVEAL